MYVKTAVDVQLYYLGAGLLRFWKIFGVTIRQMMSSNQQCKKNVRIHFNGILEPFIVNNKYPTISRRFLFVCVMVWTIALRFYIYSTEVSGLQSTEQRLAKWLSQRGEIMANNHTIPCIGTLSECEDAEDLFCQKKPHYLANYKNPCWFEEGQLKCLPYFHILGTEKGRGLDLLRKLTEHPHVCDHVPVTNYWSWKKYGSFRNIPFYLRCDFRCYVRLFRYFIRSDHGSFVDGVQLNIFGDGTVSDFSDFRNWDRIPQNIGLEEPLVLTPHLMKHIYREPRFIIVLRDPIEKLYAEATSKGILSAEAFHKATVESIEMVSDCLQHNSTRRCFFDRGLSYKIQLQVHDGCYSVYLKEWFNVFSREHFLIIRTEDFAANVEEYVKKAHHFLHLDYAEQITSSSSKLDMGSTARYLPIWDITRTILNNFYTSYSRELASMLHDDRFLWNNT